MVWKHTFGEPTFEVIVSVCAINSFVCGTRIPMSN